MQFINLTTDTVQLPNGAVLPPAAEPVRCYEETYPTGTVADVPLVIRRYRVAGLPAPAAETLYIVPALVRQTVPERSDLASPGGLLRQGTVSICADLVVNF